MNQNTLKNMKIGACISYALFVLLIILLKVVDVQAVGPQGSEIGFATINSGIHNFFGTQDLWYKLTQIFGVLAILTAVFFAFIGGFELVQRGKIAKVDKDILLLGGLYVVVVILYVVFEKIVINYRPVILETELEPSFPSTHTMLVCTIMGSAIYQFYKRIKAGTTRNIIIGVCIALIALTVIGRLMCGVHWFTDILGGVFLSTGLVLTYVVLCNKIK